jgi:hypothetical protein
VVPVHITGGALYGFSGFQPPIENSPALNRENAGSVISIRFSLDSDLGPNVVVPGYPTVNAADCESQAPTGPAIPIGSIGVRYEPLAHTYTYTWVTDRRMAGTCQQFTLLLTDGSDHVAYFQFR